MARPPTMAEMARRVSALETTKYGLDSRKFDPREHEDKTRSQLANRFVSWFFILVAIALILGLAYNFASAWFFRDNDVYKSLIIEVRDLVMLISSIVGSALGFVVGYYFKGSEKNSN